MMNAEIKWPELLAKHPHFEALVSWLSAPSKPAGLSSPPKPAGLAAPSLARESRILQGLRGSSGNMVAGLLSQVTDRPVLLVKAHLDDVESACLDWQCLSSEKRPVNIHRFPALEVMPGESHIHVELLAERLQMVSMLKSFDEAPHENRQPMIATSIQALMQCVPVEESIREYTLSLTEGQRGLALRDVVSWLDHTGYERVDAVEQPGEFSVRGGILDVLAVAGMYEPKADGSKPAEGQIAQSPLAIRLDFFGDELDGISRFDTTGMASLEALRSCRLLGAREEQLQSADNMSPMMGFLPENTLVVLDEPMELSEQGRGYYHRLTDPRGIVSHNTVFQKLARLPILELHGYGAMITSSKQQNDSEGYSWHVDQLTGYEGEVSEVIDGFKADISRHPESNFTLYCHSDAQVTRMRELITGASVEEPFKSESNANSISNSNSKPKKKAGRKKAALKKEVSKKGGQLTNLQFAIGHLQQGFTLQSDGESLTLIAAHELLNSSPVSRSRFQPANIRKEIQSLTATADGEGDSEAAADAFFEIEEGDLVVHVDHGIGIFKGLNTLKRRGETEEYLTLLFADDAVLHVPVSQMELIQKYIGGSKGSVKLSQLGGRRWKRQKEQVSESVKDLASEMLRLQAAREAIPGITYPDDTIWQKQFEAEFPYQETEDQLASLSQIKKDMMSSRSMDRLLCGDVGFGKTEVAIRAAFKAADSGKQVAILVPTTVLAEQHQRTFKSRMASYPFRVECLNRFKTGKETKLILDHLAKGKIDIVIGTHRLLSKDVSFNDLGLVIIDEEQRFGVEHKQRLLSFRMTADVLTLSATPIPRTLHMSLLGLRNISSLTTPPADRRAVVTDVISRDMNRIRQAIVRELNREGQVYFLHNRVNTIHATANDVRALVPDAKVIVGHGQMPARELEKVMLQFTRGEADVLVCTTIIESGVDIPRANTMIIDQSDHFGLAELHQLRGRVGRDRHRAYCYLLLPDNRPVTDKAIKRLRALENYAMLGAGFKIAMQDLEIRGAGNLLGAEQSGHISAVGYQMYCQLLAHEAMRLKNEPIIEPLRTHLELPLHGRIPETYIESSRKRMSMYRRFSRANSFKQYERLHQTMTEAYGPVPETVQDFLDLTELRIAASLWGIKKIRLEAPDLIYTMESGQRLKDLKQHLDGAPGRASHIEELVLYWRPPENYLDPISTLMAVLRKLLLNPVK